VIQVSPTESQRRHGVEVTVQADYENLLITPIIGAFFDDGAANLTSRTVMRVE
jgi:Na+/glutamate symporter